MSSSRSRERIKGNGVQDPLETYLREISETPLLDAVQEKQLAYRIEAGNPEAREQMVRANLRLVVNIARDYTGKGLVLQDLIEEGNLGLLRAVEGFDPEMNTRFSTYASYWIKQSIKRALVNKAKTIRLPAYMVELLAKWRRAAAQLHDELKRAATPQEIANRLGLKPKKMEIIRDALLTEGTTQDSQFEGGCLLVEMAEDKGMQPLDEISENEMRERALRALDGIDERKAKILRGRYGLDDQEPQTLTEIGKSLGLTRERVRQLEKGGVSDIREKMNGPKPSKVNDDETPELLAPKPSTRAVNTFTEVPTEGIQVRGKMYTRKEAEQGIQRLRDTGLYDEADIAEKMCLGKTNNGRKKITFERINSAFGQLSIALEHVKNGRNGDRPAKRHRRKKGNQLVPLSIEE